MKLRLIDTKSRDQENEARRKNIQNHIDLIEMRHSKEEREEVVSILRARLARLECGQKEEANEKGRTKQAIESGLMVPEAGLQRDSRKTKQKAI